MQSFATGIAALAFLAAALATPLQHADSKTEFTRVGDMLVPVQKVQARGLIYFRTWPEGVVPYYITNFSSSERTVIQNLLDEIGQRTCVKFVPATTKQKPYLDIFKGTGCVTHLGYYGGTYHGCSLTSECALTRTTVFHEVLHALGFTHEQNREDRDYSLAVHLDNAGPKEEGLMKLYDLISLGIPYNVKSTMQYNVPTDYSNNGKPVMISTRPHHPISFTGIPWSDWRRVNRLYNCHPRYEEPIDKLEF